LSGGSRIVDGHYSLSVSGDAGASYVIEASADLRHWDVVATVANTSGSVEFTDNEAASHDHRFYRAHPAAGQ